MNTACQAVLVTIALAVSALAALAWVYLLAGHGWYWRTDQRLPAGGADPRHWPRVAAVVPARNEAAVLPRTLPTLLEQDYPGEFSVLLVDDESADGTAEVASSLARDAGAACRLRVVTAGQAPPGWAGKVWAMSAGARAVDGADYLLFTDADIGFAAGTLTELVRAAEGDGRVLVSQMALLRANAFAERLLVPAFVYFFAMLYPFRLVNRPGARTAAAAGGCMLVRSTALRDAGGLRGISGARIDDVALGKLLKSRHGGGCWLGFSTAVTSRRDYPRFADVWNMVARSAYTQLRYSPVAVAGTVVGLAWLYLMPVAAAALGLTLAAWQAPWLAAAGLCAWAIMCVTYLPVLRLYRLSPLRAPCLPLIAAAYAAMTVSSALRHHAGRGGEWKGRVIAAGTRPG